MLIDLKKEDLKEYLGTFKFKDLLGIDSGKYRGYFDTRQERHFEKDILSILPRYGLRGIKLEASSKVKQTLPDLIVYLNKEDLPLSFYIEIKKPNGHLSKSQEIAFSQMVIPVYTIYSWDDLNVILNVVLAQYNNLYLKLRGGIYGF